MDCVCAETRCFDISFPLSTVSHRVASMETRWCTVTRVCLHIGLLPIPRAQSEIDVVSTQLCLLDLVCAGVFPHVSGC